MRSCALAEISLSWISFALDLAIGKIQQKSGCEERILQEVIMADAFNKLYNTFDSGLDRNVAVLMDKFDDLDRHQHNPLASKGSLGPDVSAVWAALNNRLKEPLSASQFMETLGSSCQPCSPKHVQVPRTFDSDVDSESDDEVALFASS